MVPSRTITTSERPPSVGLKWPIRAVLAICWLSQTRRRRNRTFQAVGYTALLALKARRATRPLPPRGKPSPGWPLVGQVFTPEGGVSVLVVATDPERFVGRLVPTLRCPVEQRVERHRRLQSARR